MGSTRQCAVVSLLAAGIFTGILSGTGMVEAMSRSLLTVLPDAMGPYLAGITALVSLPFTFSCPTTRSISACCRS